MKYQETIVLSLGGSLIVPNGGIDTQFLTKFNSFVRSQIAEKKRRFFVVCGGGATARSYIEAGTTVFGKAITDEDKDWLGIHSTRLNAHLLRTIFIDIAYAHVFKHYDRDYDIRDEPVVVCSGWKPGWSTDYCAVLVAEKYGAKTIINLSNIDKVYDKDPRKYKDARPIDKTTWDHFEKLVGDKWVPGLNAPFDPVATQKAKQLDLNVLILNGRNIGNLEAAIDGKKFIGTVITPFTLDASFYDREYYEGGDGLRTSTVFRSLRTGIDFLRALTIALTIRPKKVLDVGCGKGHLVYFLRKLGVAAYGLEISEYARKQALSAVKPYIKHGDIRHIPYEKNEFDLVTVFNVLEHVYEDDIAKAVSECRRVSKQYVLFKMYTRENEWLHPYYGTDLSRVSIFTQEVWERYFKEVKLHPSRRRLLMLPKTLETAYLLEKS